MTDRQHKATPEKIGIDELDSFLVQVKRIPDIETKCGTKGTKPYIISIDHLLETAKKCGLDIAMKNQTPYLFNGRFWQRIEEKEFEHFLQAVGTTQGIPYGIIRDHSFVAKLVKQFASVARFPILTENDVPKINLRNGTLHFTAERIELKSFDKRDGLAYQLHYDFDPSATAPQFKEFIEHVLPNKAVRKLIFQYIGYIFLRKMNLEKILFFYGSGSNGKSVFLDVVKALIGEEQCCEFSLESITNDMYTRAQLGNYILNVCSEISERLKADIFKKLASREPLQARHPYGRPFKITEYATCIFAMNKFPKDVEQTNAFFRRFLIVEFGVCIPDEEQDTELAKKITGSEMSGVLNYVIRGAKSLLKAGQFDIPPVVQKAIENFRTDSDSVLTFLEENRYRPSNEHWKSLRAIYDAYVEQCKADREVPVSKKMFSKRLSDIGYKKDTRGHDKQVAFCMERGDDTESAE